MFLLPNPNRSLIMLYLSLPQINMNHIAIHRYCIKILKTWACNLEFCRIYYYQHFVGWHVCFLTFHFMCIKIVHTFEYFFTLDYFLLKTYGIKKIKHILDSALAFSCPFSVTSPYPPDFSHLTNPAWCLTIWSRSSLTVQSFIEAVQGYGTGWNNTAWLALLQKHIPLQKKN